ENASENEHWALVNRNEPNQWYIGHASNLESGALFITNNGGASNHYSINAASCVYAYRTVNFSDDANYEINYSWRSNGEAHNDILRVYLIHDSIEINPDDFQNNTIPTEWIDIHTGNFNGHLQLQTARDTVSMTSGVYKLVFFWKNNSTLGTQPPAAIDYVAIRKILPVYTVLTCKNGSGSVSPEGFIEVTEGEDTTFTFSPNANNYLASVLVDSTDVTSEVVNNTYTLHNVHSNHHLQINFERVHYTITATANQNGSITPNGEIDVLAGSNLSLAITPDEGYQIASVVVDQIESINLVNNLTFTFNNITRSHTITVSFVEEPTQYYEITAIYHEGG
ncbi:MAG: hypothetical protein HUK15_05175, partial [Bacteroidales bacterium]|nr:hypothetical protein [Bacteroidales bacterium]